MEDVGWRATECVLWRVPRRTFHDVLALLGGQPPDSSSRRSAEESRALVDRMLDCWRVLPSVPEDVLDGSLRSALQDDDYRRLHNCWLAVRAFTRAQFAACRGLIEALEQSGMDYSLLKGAATGLRVYPDPSWRASTDFDVGVARADLGRAEALARQAGFHPAQKNDRTNRFERVNPLLRAAVEARHYELCFLVRRLQVTNIPDVVLEAVREEAWARAFWRDGGDAAPWCYAVVDIHHALSLDIPLDDLISTAQVVTAAGGKARIPNDSWLAIHLIYKLYWEGVHNYGKGLYQYADLSRLIPSMDRSAFDALVALLERHNLVAAGHYVLRRLPEFGLDPPEHVRAFVEDTFRPPADDPPADPYPFTPARRPGPERLNDLGDMWARLWGQR